jgi:hypothetical protein
MLKLIVLLCLGLWACSPQPIVITATLSPVPSATASPVPSPTVQALNPHADCLRFNRPEDCIVNENAYLDAPYRLQVKAHDGREVYAPSNWTFVRDGGAPAYPNVMCVSGDCSVSMHSTSGAFGWRSGGITVYPNQRYLLITRYTFACNSAQTSLTTVRPYAVIRTSAPAQTTMLVEQSLTRATGYNENLWVIETSKTHSDVVLDVWFSVPFGVCGQSSALTVHSVELIPVNPAYGGDTVTRF